MTRGSIVLICFCLMEASAIADLISLSMSARFLLTGFFILPSNKFYNFLVYKYITIFPKLISYYDGSYYLFVQIQMKRTHKNGLYVIKTANTKFFKFKQTNISIITCKFCSMY